MNDTEARLRARLADLERRMTRTEAELDTPGNPDVEDQATERESDEVLEALGQGDLAEVRMIRAALDRLAEGTYGICVACGEAISPERLRAVPHAARCRNCA